MFQVMRRSRQALSWQETEEILRRGTSGVLALAGAEGDPYAVPLSYVYTQGILYVHCAKVGHKLESIRRCEKASFCVVDRDEIKPEAYTTIIAARLLLAGCASWKARKKRGVPSSSCPQNTILWTPRRIGKQS